jgi:hypothetical protein
VTARLLERAAEVAAQAPRPGDTSDRRLYAPDGEAWCRFGRGLACLNRGDCRNPNHREVHR